MPCLFNKKRAGINRVDGVWICSCVYGLFAVNSSCTSSVSESVVLNIGAVLVSFTGIFANVQTSPSFQLFGLVGQVLFRFIVNVGSPSDNG